MSRLLSGAIEGQQPDPLQNLLQQALMPQQQQQVAIPSMNPAQNQGMDRRKAMWDVLGAIGMGLATGNPGTSAQMFQQMSQQREERKQRDMANNASAQYLKAQKAEHLIPLVQSGRMTMTEAIQLARGKSGYRVLTPDEKKQYGLPVDGAFQIGPDEKISSIGGGGVTVNNDLRAETEYDKTLGKKMAETYTGIQDEAMKASSAKSSLTAMESMLDDPGFYSGAGGESVLAAKRLGQAMGFDPSGIDSMEAFNAMAKKAALDTMGGSLGTGFSNADRIFIEEQVPNLGNTPEGNRRIIDIQRRIAQRKMQIRDFANQYAAQNGGRIDAKFYSALSQWAASQPDLFADMAAGSRNDPLGLR